MLDNLLTEQINPSSRTIDRVPVETALRLMNSEDALVPAAVEAEIPNIARAVERITLALRQGGRLFYLGAGTSGRMGVLDAAECPPTFQVAPDLVQGIIAGGEKALARATEATEDDPAMGKADLEARGFRVSDVLVGIAASGRTPYVLGAVKAAKELGALTVGVSCSPGSELAGAVDVAITPLVGPEVIAGSTRMKAGTATKLVLNMISTAVMIQLGYVYGNLMVNVQPKNSKLRDRAERIIAEAAQIPAEQARQLLKQAGDQVATAIVMSRLALSPEAARERLRLAGGRIAEALQT